MANLYVTFSRVSGQRYFNAPIADGASARTETIEIPSASDGSAAGTLTAAAGETHVEVHAGADCWVAIGATPEAEAGTGDSRFIPSGATREFAVSEGHKVAVIGV